MIELQQDTLVFRFPQVHDEAVCRIDFQRTLRIPDDNRDYPLPPGLGSFPLFHVDDYAKRLPKIWHQHGGAFLPIHQSEAMWINFTGIYPMAVKIAAGKINAVTGDAWSNEICESPQDYVVIPEQRWLDGFCVEKGRVRQFVAMPLGGGYTAEEQLTGAAEHGGVQIVVYPMRAERYEALRRPARFSRTGSFADANLSERHESYAMSMGLAPGGLMRQDIREDRYGLAAWDTSAYSRCFVHLLNSEQFQTVTGAAPPDEPPSARDYTTAGLPWFEYYATEGSALQGARRLARLDSLAARRIKEGAEPLADNDPVDPVEVRTIRDRSAAIRDGEF